MRSSSDVRALGRVLSIAGSALLASTGHAWASDSPSAVDEAIGLYHEGEFEGALEVLERAAVEPGVTRDVLARVFECEALAHYGLDRVDDMDQALLRLATLDPGHTLVAEAPPRVQAAFAAAVQRAGRGLALHLRVEPRDVGGVLVARVDNDVAGLSDGVRLYVREGAGAWTMVDAMRVNLNSGAGRYEYRGEILGTGGVVLGSVGSLEAPLVWALADGARVDRPRKSRRSPWLWVGIGAAVAVVAAGTVAIVLASGGGGASTDVGDPRVDFLR